MNNEEGYDDYNVFIRQCIKQLNENKVCYCYTLYQVEDIQKRYKRELHITKNECGYTLSVLKKEVKKK